MDEIVNDTDANAIVVTSSHEKIFSSGVDLDWLSMVIQKKDSKSAREFFKSLNELFKRILLFPMPTIAAITGHAFGFGAILCCTFDFRFMRSDKGFLCFPEVDLGIPFLPGMIALIKKAIPINKIEEMLYTGKRVTAEECRAHQIVLKACHVDDLMNDALSYAKSLNKKRAIIADMKKKLYKEIIHTIDVEDASLIESDLSFIWNRVK